MRRRRFFPPVPLGSCPIPRGAFCNWNPASGPTRMPLHRASNIAPCPVPSVPRQAPAHEERSLRSEEHTSELQSLMRISYAVFCLKKKNRDTINLSDIPIYTYRTRYNIQTEYKQ